MKEIQTLVEELRIYAQETSRWIILALHSALSIGEQDKVSLAFISFALGGHVCCFLVSICALVA